ncbi:hypothetical protein PMAYCL1PPCAC_08582, partial [Pristionchus mayeri]
AGGYRSAFRSVSLDELPETEDRVRAHLHLGAVQFRPHPDYPENKTISDFVTLIDMKGMLPQFIVNQILPKLMVTDAEVKVQHFRGLSKKISYNWMSF